MSLPVEERAALYVDRALEDEVGKVARAGYGGRNVALNDSAFALGRLLPNFPISEADIEGALLGAVSPHLDSTMTEREAYQTIRHAMADGARKSPRPGLDGVSLPGQRLKGEIERPAIQVEPAQPKRPPHNEVEGIWHHCLPVDAPVEPAEWNLEPVRWIEGRGLDSELLAAHNLARMFPEEIELPEWAGFKSGRRWPESGFRLVVPLCSASGRMESLHVRRTMAGGGMKGAFPLGFELRGLAMANGSAVALLQGEGCPGKVILAEGIPDYLTVATTMPEAAVFGCVSGSWLAEHARAIPDGTTVYLCSDLDGAGAKYVERQKASFAGRNVNLRVLDKGRMGAYCERN
jgi:hypothetical protein